MDKIELGLGVEKQMAKKRKTAENRTKQSIEKYLEEIGGYSPLAPEDEIDLARQIRKGNSRALDANRSRS